MLPGAILFTCNLNRVRSPMAAALLKHRFGTEVYVDSCGLVAGEGADPLAVAIMAEIGLDLAGHAPKPFEALSCGAFDLVISLTPEAHAHALELTRALGVEVEHWTIPDPTDGEGSREQRLELYRQVRNDLDRRIQERMTPASRFRG